MYSKQVTLAITGASGVQYGLRLLDTLIEVKAEVFVLVSDAAKVVAELEANIHLPTTEQGLQKFFTEKYQAAEGQINVLSKQEWTSAVASGSGAPKAMVVCPCSSGCLSAIATGASNNLIERAADVALKERNQLILVPREAPYSEIHLEHMLKLTRMGALIIPASPGFYHQPQTVADMIDFVVARILQQLDIKQTLMPGWGVESEAKS